MSDKKLSEIGLELWESSTSGDFYDLDAWVELVPEERAVCEPRVVLTPDERRELVRRVWNRAQDQRSALHMEGARDMSAEEFMEREGL